MRLRSLKSKILLAVSVLVTAGGLLIALMVTQRYGAALEKAMEGQAENLAHAVALDATDKILINDLVALQRMLDQQLRSHPGLGYLLVLREGRVLAHTFDQGVPRELLGANEITAPHQPGFRRVVSQTGAHYLDVAWPIFEGKAGTLRLGFSEDHYRSQVTRLWLEMGGFTLGVLFIALALSLVFVRRITRPLADLVQATQKIDRGEAHVQVAVKGQDEIAALAASFNQMVSRQEEYTRRLEDQAMELERAYGQTKTACRIVREISALQTLDEMGGFLLTKLQDTLGCGQMLLLLFNAAKDTRFVLSRQGARDLKDPVSSRLPGQPWKAWIRPRCAGGNPLNRR
jgi:two-component system response regulator HydG